MSDNQIHVAGGIIIRNKKALVGRTRNRPFFIAPGGKLENGETAKQALIRELKEEFNIDIDDQNLKAYGTIYEDAALGDHNKGKVVRMDAFMVTKWTGEPKATGEVNEIAWVDSSALKTMQLGSVFKNHIIPRLKKEGLIS